jgi:peptide/nickel transport system permease protein
MNGAADIGSMSQVAEDLPASKVWRLVGSLRREASLYIALALVAFLVVLAVFGPLAWPRDPLAMDFAAPLAAPSLDHPMGTDGNGRDILARFIYGARISLSIGAAVVLTGLVVGGGIGLLAGIGGWIADLVLMRLIDAVAAFPPLILAMAVTVGLGNGLKTAGLGIMLSTVPFYARLVRADVFRLRSLPFIEATIALGAKRRRIVLRHLVPHTASTMLIQSAAVFGYSILALAGLGFVGLGAQIPTPEWGTMITDGMQYALTGGWWVAVFPGLGVLVAAATVNVIADRLRDHVDPRGRQIGVV